MSKHPIQPQKEDLLEELEGQLAIDVYQTDDAVVLKAPIAGVKPEDLEISITDEVINIKGTRKHIEEVDRTNYHAQECYWGTFSRSFSLPVAVISEKAEASLKNGILMIRIPKLEKARTKMIEIKMED
ncbi:MAG: Hsp20/alpha crystallin family protein [Candidatus Berkelbacteria bacterium]